jgi:hypothetical protein
MVRGALRAALFGGIFWFTKINVTVTEITTELNFMNELSNDVGYLFNCLFNETILFALTAKTAELVKRSSGVAKRK